MCVVLIDNEDEEREENEDDEDVLTTLLAALSVETWLQVVRVSSKVERSAIRVGVGKFPD